jgi:hypothetical protein
MEQMPTEEEIQIQELIKKANDWIKIAKDKLEYFGNMYGGRDKRKKVDIELNRQGADAPKDKIEHQQWLKQSERNLDTLILYLEDAKSWLEQGRTVTPYGANIEKEIDVKINALG